MEELRFESAEWPRLARLAEPGIWESIVQAVARAFVGLPGGSRRTAAN